MTEINKIAELFQGIATDLTTTVGNAWDSIVSWFQVILEWFQNIPSWISDLFAPKGGSGGGNTTITNNNSFYGNIISDAENGYTANEEMMNNLMIGTQGRR